MHQTWTYHIALPQRYPTVYIGSWAHVPGAPSYNYSWDAVSALSATLPEHLGVADEVGRGLDATLANGNRVLVYYNPDRPAPITRPEELGQLVYAGTLEEYQADLDKGGIRLTIQPAVRSARQTRISAAVSGDTASSVRTLIYNAGIQLDWDPSNPRFSGVNYTATFADTPLMDAIESLAVATGSTWFTGVTPRNTLLFTDVAAPGVTRHVLAYGQEVIGGTLGKSSNHARKQITVRYQTTGGAQGTTTVVSSSFSAFDPRAEIVLLPGQVDATNAALYAQALLQRAEQEYIVGELLVSHDQYDTASIELGHRVNVMPYRGRLPAVIASLEPESALMTVNGIAWSAQGVRLSVGLAPLSLQTIGATSARAAANYLRNLV